MAGSWTSVQIATLAVEALTDMRWWDEPSMAALFTTGGRVDDIQAAHDELAERFRADLYVTRQNQPLLATRP